MREAERRRPGATGVPIVLSDGQSWLLARPTFRASVDGLTDPPIDGALDRVFDRSLLEDGISLLDVWAIARELLRANYELTDEEVAKLLRVSAGAESRALATGVMKALVDEESDVKSYTSWARASLLANGLGEVSLAARDVTNVLAILVATGRTIPLSRFADACRRMEEQGRLESLV